jgi:autotransporter-associated beta strand protein
MKSLKLLLNGLLPVAAAFTALWLAPSATNAASLTWKGDGTANNWDLTTANWLNGATPSVFAQGDSATFDDTGSATPAVNLTGSLQPSSITVNASQNYTFSGSGSLDGAGSLAQIGSGTLILSGANSFSGGITISNGTVQLNGQNSGGSGAITINNATLALSEGGGNTFGNLISGNGTINMIGTGNGNYLQINTSLSGFTGVFNIGYSGVGRFVTRNANGGLGSGITVNVTTNGQLFIQSGSVAGPMNVSGTGDGDGYGSLREEGGLGSITGPITLLGNTAISSHNNPDEITGAIGDGGNGYGFTKLNTGTLQLSGTNTYSGATIISNGTVSLGANGSISNSSAIQLAGGTFDVSLVSGGFSLNTSPSQTLKGAGTVNGSFNAPAGSQIVPGDIGVGGHLVFNSGLTLNGQTIAFDLEASSGSSGNDLVTVTGSPLTLTANCSISLNLLAGSLSPGTYTLFTYPSLAGTGTFTLASTPPGATLNVGPTATTLSVVLATNATSLTWKGDGTANNWDLTTANWLNGATPSVFAQSNSVTFDDTGSATPPVNITGSLQPSSITVNASQNYTFSGPGSLDGAGSLAQIGSGTLIINNSNSFTGGTVISSGTLQLGTNGSAGSIAGPIIDNSTLVFDHSNTNSYANAISGTGSLTVNGSGLEILTTDNTYTGGTTINAGTLQLNTPAAAGPGPVPVVVNSALNLLAGGSYFSNSISGSGVINILPVNLLPTGGNDYAQFNGSLNINATINVPVGPGYARVVTTAANGNASALTINVTNGGQLYVQSVPLPPNNFLAANISVAGVGNGEALGAIRIDPGAFLTGTVTLTGDATLSAFNGVGTISGTITETNGSHGLTITSTQTNRSNIIDYSSIHGLYSGNTTIDVGSVLGLLSGAAIENSPAINISSDAMFDVSQDGVASYPIPTGISGAATTQMLAGTGENGIINGSITLGSGGSLGVAISSDGQPDLIMTGGTLTLSNNPVIVTALSLPLTGGIYPLVTNGAGGTVVGDVSTSPLTFAGAGLASGATASLLLTNSALYLVVNQTAATPAIFSSVSELPGNGGLQLVLSGSNGHNYSLLATTNLLAPLTNWNVIATGTFGAGSVTNIDLGATNYPQRFYDILSQ